MTTFVRVRDEHGNRFSLSAASPDLALFEQIEEDAVDRNGDVIDPWVARDHLDEETDAVDPYELKGQKLAAALEAAGLGVSGTADEKRARLAEHLASQEAPTGHSANDPEETS